jgi:hypothetical protein
MMPRIARSLTAIAALLLAAVYVVPLWTIQLVAPQYPEGLGMLIRVNTVTGVRPNDLDNINHLNHYIGMREIDPNAIPVLTVMPWVVAGLIATGLAVALVGRRRLLYAWLAVFAICAVAGMAEFWWWEYQFGHDLDPNAIMTIPGMSYQPPLLGSKQIANFVATSWPGLGGWAAGIAFLLASAAVVLTRRDAARRRAVAATVSGPATLRTAEA